MVWCCFRHVGTVVHVRIMKETSRQTSTLSVGYMLIIMRPPASGGEIMASILVDSIGKHSSLSFSLSAKSSGIDGRPLARREDARRTRTRERWLLLVVYISRLILLPCDTISWFVCMHGTLVDNDSGRTVVRRLFFILHFLFWCLFV